MDVLTFAAHLLGFAAPAAALAVLVAGAARLLWRGKGLAMGWWAGVLLNFVVGLAVLGAGLAFFGRDGKMATYAALVLAVATVQWLASRGWRG